MKTFVYRAAAAVIVLGVPLGLYADEPERPGPPKPELLFMHLDQNGDGQLTLEEFAEGTNQLHKAMMESREPMRPMFGPAMPPPPLFGSMMPPPMPPFPPSAPGFGLPGGMQGPRPGGPMHVARGDRPLPPPWDARLEALEEKLDAIEAALQDTQPE